MFISNFRCGFATNSSSSHSVVLIPPSMIGKVSTTSNAYDGYGWDFFRLVTQEDKLRYLAAQFFMNFAKEKATREQIIARFEQEIPGYAESVTSKPSYQSDEDDLFEPPYVDHQSVFEMSTFSSQTLDDMIAFFKSPRVVVCGGNDNEEHPPAIQPDGSKQVDFFESLMTDGSGPGHPNDNIRAKREGDFWVAFNYRDGTKVRFCLGEDEREYTKAITPELVDLKITDFCDKGCNFCYQSSTTAGRHADFDTILKTLDMFADMQVFEVALGGGEPTSHPRFADILRACEDRAIKPNFTTLSDNWLIDEEIVDAVLDCVGGIGVSCHDKKGLTLVDHIETVLEDRKDARNHRPGGIIGRSARDNTRVMAQHVVGAAPVYVTTEFLNAAFADFKHVLLLGYKEVGFGKAYRRHDDKTFTMALKLAVDTQEGRAGLSVDTALVDLYPDLTTVLGVPDALVSSPEGKFSCYVDAVAKTMGPSSYVEADAMIPLAMSVDDFKTEFAKW